MRDQPPTSAILDRAENLLGELRGVMSSLRAGEPEGSEARAERRALEQLVATAERQAAQLANLYTATYQLHSTLEPADVQGAIADVAVNLLGARSFALLLRGDEDCQVVIAEGIDDPSDPLVCGAVYLGGDPVVDLCLNDGTTRLGPTTGSRALAVVPLAVQGATVGALVILELLGHKLALQREDRELLDLLGAHAGSALFAAQVFQERTRKLRTLEGLVALLRHEKVGERK